MNRREEIIFAIDRVPLIPASVTKIQQLIQNPDVDFNQLAELIRYDPGLTANLLRLANSAYFGFTRTISTVQQAIVRLGINRLFKILLTAAVAPLLQSEIKGYDIPKGKMWEHSIAVAIGAEKLARILHLSFPPHTFTTGLLVDIGKIVLGTFIEVGAKPIMELAFERRIPFDVAERRVLGIDHSEVGAILLSRWNLPPDMVSAGRWHHQPQRFEGDSTVIDLVHTADVLVMGCGIGVGRDGLNYRPSREVFQRLALNNHINERVMKAITDDLSELRNLFKMN